MKTLYSRFRDELELRGFAPRSIETYIRLVKKLGEYYLRSPDEITDEELREYMLHLLRKRKYARPTMIGVVCALRAFYRWVLRRPTDHIEDILPRIRTRVHLPQFYSKEEIERLLTVKGIRLKQRTMLITAYAAGLRVSEVCRLKVTDIRSSRMQIHVRQGKGRRKDRYTVLSPKLLNILRNYWRVYRPRTWLFPNPKNPNKPLNPRSLQRTFKCAIKLAGLRRRGGIHSLRHSFATHMLDSGVELPTLQSLLGHAWLVSTMVYLHASRHKLAQARSPLDLIDIGPAPVEVGTESRPREAPEPGHDDWWKREPD